jgi:hypothetical protein
MGGAAVPQRKGILNERITTITTLSSTTQSPLVRALHRSGLLAEDLDYHVVRASMVIMFFFFGYQKWFPYEFDRKIVSSRERFSDPEILSSQLLD